MKKALIIALLISIFNSAIAQTDSADHYVKLGVESHDKGKYDEALAMYDKALQFDATITLRNTKRLTLTYLQKDTMTA